MSAALSEVCKTIAYQDGETKIYTTHYSLSSDRILSLHVAKGAIKEDANHDGNPPLDRGWDIVIFQILIHR